MPERPWRVALIDSGLAPGPQPGLVDAVQFIDDGAEIRQTPPIDDQLGHGTLMFGIVATGTAAQWLNAQVFGAAAGTTAATVAAALDWAVVSQANLVHLSLGLRDDRRVLADAVARTIAAGCIIVASTPARGESSFPARYPGVIRATGDARCSAGEISALATVQADFGACPRFAGQRSIGAAHLTRFILGNLDQGLDAAQIRSELTKMAHYRGPESRRE